MGSPCPARAGRRAESAIFTGLTCAQRRPAVSPDLRLTEWALRRFTALNVRDYDKLLHISDDFTVSEIEPDEGSWLSGRRLEELRLRDEGVMVLGVHREDGSYLGIPSAATTVPAGDRLVAYGEGAAIPELSARRAGPEGDAAYQRAVEAYRSTR